MQTTYKKVKVYMPHCGDCGERLNGQGSSFSPYSCSCGTWESSWTNPSELKLKEVK